MTLPVNLQNLTFGARFDQSLAGMTLPVNLQRQTFGDDFDQSFAGVTLPGSLQSLTFGESFSQSLAGVTLPGSLQSLTLCPQAELSCYFCAILALEAQLIQNKVLNCIFGVRAFRAQFGATSGAISRNSGATPRNRAQFQQLPKFWSLH
ncbi:unnamed protein product [Effrenium voratum]|uniref:Uncharacterized protein n=1 Tax=Effrenium voratum TaxID=2562239 RepID=A0AA36JNC6_9DINO|nr:unnamed protein product [Effrenium voratum]